MKYYAYSLHDSMIYNIKNLLNIILIIISLICIIKIIWDRRDPKGTFAWILFFISFKSLAIVTFLLIGRNWRNKKFINKSANLKKDLFENYNVVNELSESAFIGRLIEKTNPSPLFKNNKIKIFTNGKEKFDSLKNELKNAKHHIHLEYYIVRNDKIGNEIKDILINKSRDGVKVRFIIDKIGSIGLGRKYINHMKKAGIDVSLYSYCFSPFYRNHKKIVIIDGSTGFLGGMNIGDEYEGKGNLGFWEDLHMMIKGDFVLGLQFSFINDYCMLNKKNNTSLFIKDDYDNYFPKSTVDNILPMQVIESGPSSENPSIMYSMINMISNAKDHVYIMTPYFIPSESLLTVLKIAVLKGIDVKILFPGKSDHFHVYFASKTYLYEMAKCGAKIYLYPKDSFLHSKAILVDGKVCTLGNANIDIRSFELNYELNAIIYDPKSVSELEGVFHKECNQSNLATGEFFENSSLPVKLLENVTRIFSNAM